jgi:2-haloacid dehalogenase
MAARLPVRKGFRAGPASLGSPRRHLACEVCVRSPEIVLFDIGGVLIDWNPRHLYRKLFDGDEVAMERFLAEVCSPAWNHRLDEGRPFAEALAELTERHPEQAAHIRAYLDRWLEMIAGPIEPTAALLEALDAAGRPLWAITNWSAETLPLVRADPTFAFLDRFRGIFVSGELRMAKPAEPIFRHALGAIGAPAGACLFIDDSPANIATARRLGMQTHEFRSPDGLAAELRRLALIA